MVPLACLLRAPIWYPLMPEPKIKTVVQAFETPKVYYAQFLRNELSYTPYDNEYVYKHPESATKGGALYWQDIDLQDPELEEKGNQWLLEKMDFPIIALALSYDMFDPPAKEVVGLMAVTAPLWGSMMAQYAEATSGIPGFPRPGGSGLTIASAFKCPTRS
ncbi:hypothetical protein SCAR479_02769 [Seiridium cardinale]|uniref:Uncharacterized protein n=1 Tax=Seiridium cardinale TaxID=138064 RepID=A0ABR2Y2W2_9PEZI